MTMTNKRLGPSHPKVGVHTCYARLFARSLEAAPRRLHFAAHSHHLWPDAAYDGHMAAWNDAMSLADDKWSRIFGETLPEASRHVARILQLPDPGTVVFASNTHEFLTRLYSCFDPHKVTRVLTTNGEFHSFDRQTRRLEEAGLVKVERVETEPFESFDERFIEAAYRGDHDMVFVSHVFFDSGFLFERFKELRDAVSQDSGAFVVIDAYHSFCALPVDFSDVADRFFVLGGGYKYAMSGEGACFLHCPPGYGQRPLNTGWFAAFGGLADSKPNGRIDYAEDGTRFFGATFDTSGIHRFNAVMRMLDKEGITTETIHAWVSDLQACFLESVEGRPIGAISLASLIPDQAFRNRGHFLTFRTPAATQICNRLHEHDIFTDCRDDRIRIGFSIYHDRDAVEHFVERLRELLS